MDQIQELWSLEKQFWLGDAAFYERTLAPGAIMVLPEPAGVLDRAATVEAISSSSRWQSASMKNRSQAVAGSPSTAADPGHERH